ncbi:MAG: septum formation protein Maf [Candidatus Omnitrophica bacterium]|nr:septum formation protein Maf [Candidatus Omnitrophota bacterium]
MKKIILASGSAQRKNLMKLLKLPFVIRRSGAEEIMKIKTNVADLVKENAFIKALDVAEETKEDAIVIGADTVVYVKGKLVLKPKDLKEAKKNLKELMSSPHWVYTGVALIDTSTGKSLVDYEKTKIFMTKLNDDEIDRYHQEVPPMDKAGGFDIEGRGGLFIPRIEGCYFNVVGLPLAKLAQMLKKFGVHAMMLAIMFTASGCGGIATSFNPATDAQETSVYSTDHEVQIGAAVATEIEKEFKVVEDQALNARAERISDRIVKVCDRKELVYITKVVEEKDLKGEKPMVNAVSLPGGYIYIFKGLMDYIKNDDQLAAVIAHEVGHITARHSIKRIQASYGSMALMVAAIVTAPQVAGGVVATMESMFLAYSQEDEIQADSLGVKYMKAAGFDPNGMTAMLEQLQEYDRKQPPRPKIYGRTHPYVHQRIASADRMIKGELSFRDYIRLTGEREDYAK